ncbi:PAS domain S-box protein [Neorhizobium lilium]|uniref:Blue-light-activated histidine kinase n=1 Tax=Neorhizobium lilium TaxID=2503024 RepID=A0A3S3S8F5_9HYPH|nr:PAS domain S-box protein [Neorhizobium lilium]
MVFPAGGGETGELIRNFDWSKTPLGPLSGWPQSLKTVTNMLLLSPVPIVLLWGEDGIMIYNDAYSGFAGSRHPQLLGSKVREGWAEIADFNDNVMKVGLAGGTLAYENQQLTLFRRGKPEPVWMNLDYSPVVDESGRPRGVIAIVVETTQEVLGQQKLRQSEQRFRALTEATSDIVYRMSPHWTEIRQLDGRGFLTDVASPSTAWQEEYLLPEDRPVLQQVIDEAVRSKSVFQHEHRVRRTDGTIGWIFSRAVPILDDQGEIVEWFGAASDVTERRRNEEYLRLVVHELNHRVKNNLAMTQAIAAQTFRNVTDLKEAQARFSGRMVALGQANDLLTGERWVGASLLGAIRQAIHPHCPEEHRCETGGQDVKLSPKTALALTLAAHELATNALKYGAWSDETGKVVVSCSTYKDSDGNERIRIEWRESGGPPVLPPQRRGFGSTLIERGLTREMGGEVKMDFQPDGLVCIVDAPESPYAKG